MDNEHVCVYYWRIYCAAHSYNKGLSDAELTRDDLDIANELWWIYRDEVSASVGLMRFNTSLNAKRYQHDSRTGSLCLRAHRGRLNVGTSAHLSGL